MRTREEFLALTGRRDFASRPLDPALQKKLDRILEIKAKRDTLNRARSIAERMVALLKQAQDRRRLASVGGGGEDYLLAEAILLRGELYSLEV